MYFTGQPRGSLGAIRGQHFPEPLPTSGCCDGCASGKGGCGGHTATGDFSTTLIGIGLVVGITLYAMHTMKKVAR